MKNKNASFYRRILFTGKTVAPSSPCSLPDLYILMPKCMHVNQKKKKKKAPPWASGCPVSCSLIGCRSSLMYFSVRTHSHSRIVNRRQLQILACQIFPGRRIIHTARLSLAWMGTDLPPISGICLQFIKTYRQVKNRAKIVQCELAIKHH